MFSEQTVHITIAYGGEHSTFYWQKTSRIMDLFSVFLDFVLNFAYNIVIWTFLITNFKKKFLTLVLL